MAVINFDATSVVPSTGVQDAIPAGWYNAAAESSELKPTKDSSPSNPAAFLQIVFKVLDGQFAGRKIFARFNIRNANPTAQEIAYRDLSALAHAVGVLQIGDSQQLHGIPLKIKVKVRAAQGDYEASNEITSYKNINEQVGATTAAPAQPTFTPPPVAIPQAAPQQWAPQPQPAHQAPQAWQAPQAAQPWAAAPVQAPAQPQQPAPQQFTPPPQQAPLPPFMAAQQPVQPAPVQQFQPPSGGAVPPWGAMSGQQG
jgi:hypothetical protein